MSAEQKQARIEQLKLDFNGPVLIDSSVYVMYPLPLNSHIRTEESSSYGSSYESRSDAFWNIVFYNTATGAYHLLDPNRKMVIYSYTNNETNSGSSAASSYGKYQTVGYSQVGQLLYYAVTTTDYNRDGEIDSKDPSYLFISDKSGRNFKQISPEGLNVTSWDAIKGTSKILLQTTKDTNGNKLFGDMDEIVPLVYDLKMKGHAQPIFSSDFKTLMKTQLSSQWVKGK